MYSSIGSGGRLFKFFAPLWKWNLGKESECVCVRVCRCECVHLSVGMCACVHVELCVCVYRCACMCVHVCV